MGLLIGCFFFCLQVGGLITRRLLGGAYKLGGGAYKRKFTVLNLPTSEGFWERGTEEKRFGEHVLE